MTSKKPIPYTQIKQLIINKVMPLRIKALIAIQYGTGARISEIITYTNAPKHKFFQGITKQDIETKENYTEFRLNNLKNKKNTTKIVGIPNKKEAWLLKPIMDWIKFCETNNLFELHESKARKLIKKETGFSSHYLRHSRATHLAQEFGFNAYEIQQTLGHAKLDTSQIYVNSNLEDRIKKMEKNILI